MEKPTVIWRAKVSYADVSYLARAVRRDIPNVPPTDPPKTIVLFEFLEGRDSMDEQLWHPISQLPNMDAWAIKDAFILDASAFVAKNPILEQEP